MPIYRRFLPKRVSFGLTGFLDDLGKAHRFYLQQFHRKKSARELRQRRSDYRCCIPALAGFVSPQSIAPDGSKSFAQVAAVATLNKQAPETWGSPDDNDESMTKPKC